MKIMALGLGGVGVAHWSGVGAAAVRVGVWMESTIVMKL